MGKASKPGSAAERDARHQTEAIDAAAMSWWISLILLSLGIGLWLKGRSNPDDVIGLLEKLLSATVVMVVLFVNHNLWLEITELIAVLQLPMARQG